MDLPLRKLELAGPLSDEEEAAVRGACARDVRFPAHSDIAAEGDTPVFSIALLEGMLCRYKRLADGTRQIIAFHVAGDWPDLQSFFLPAMDHSLMTMNKCRVAQVPHAALSRLMDKHPRIARLLWRETLTDSAIFREWVVNLGARDAHSRAAHLFCELDCKLRVVGLADEGGFDLPATQADLADALGISTVHVNRILQQLRAEGVISADRGRITIHDRERLRKIAGFDANYLHLSHARNAGAAAAS